jgi:23S rRNA (cytosine1962-C5)-methyltransferase
MPPKTFIHKARAPRADLPKRAPAASAPANKASRPELPKRAPAAAPRAELPKRAPAAAAPASKAPRADVPKRAPAPSGARGRPEPSAPRAERPTRPSEQRSGAPRAPKPPRTGAATTADGLLRVRLSRGKSKPFWVGHPWVFSGAIDEVRGTVTELGGLCLVEDERDNVLGWGYYNPSGQIAVRLWVHRRSTDLPFETPDFKTFLAARLADALALRKSLGLVNRTDLNVYRLVNAEGDGLSGLIVDRLGDVLSVQLNSRGMVEHRATVLDALRRVTGLEKLLVAIPDTAARMEGLIPSLERVGPSSFTESKTLEVVENGVSYAIDLAAIQKTGFYADQRDNRLQFAASCKGARVLDAYCHSGGFGLQALKHGAAHVTFVDSSEPTIEAARRNAERNGVADRAELLADDAITFLKEKQALGETWPRVIIDPPKFAQGRTNLEDALQKYARLNTLALSVLAEDGLMVTCSCSQHVSEEDFGRMLTDAGHRLRKTVRVLARWGQPADHPTASVAPEGRYLKAWLISATSR